MTDVSIISDEQVKSQYIRKTILRRRVYLNEAEHEFSRVRECSTTQKILNEVHYLNWESQHSNKFYLQATIPIRTRGNEVRRQDLP